jgi:hypothetical protein
MYYKFYLHYTITQIFCVIKTYSLSKYGRILDSTIRYHDSIMPDENRSDSESRLWLPMRECTEVFPDARGKERQNHATPCPWERVNLRSLTILVILLIWSCMILFWALFAKICTLCFVCFVLIEIQIVHGVLGQSFRSEKFMGGSRPTGRLPEEPPRRLWD